jgi:hypothetical protein
MIKRNVILKSVATGDRVEGNLVGWSAPSDTARQERCQLKRSEFILLRKLRRVILSYRLLEIEMFCWLRCQ